MLKVLAFLLSLLAVFPVHAADEVWKDLPQASEGAARVFTFDAPQLVTRLDAGTAAARGADGNAYIELPLPDGGAVKLEAEEYSIMEAGAVADGGFRSWKVKGLDSANISGVIDVSTSGFHAMLFMPDGKTVFIDPLDGTAATHKSYFKADASRSMKFRCGVHDLTQPLSSLVTDLPAQRLTAVNDEATLDTRQRQYRLAMAATSAFTNYHGGVSNAINEIQSIVSRVSEIYQRDLGIKLVLVGNNSDVVFTTATNPYFSNTDSYLVSVNTRVLNDLIGEGNYDVGHVVTYYRNAIGGLAYEGQVCNGANKGGGATGSTSPTQDDSFTIDFVAHELGHQFGATHTFNSNTGSCSGGNREPRTAYEPGSGSSIMAYAGLCAPNNIASNSVPYFHIGSIEQIESYTRFTGGGGTACGRFVNIVNSPPDIVTIDTDVIVNAGEAFELTAEVTDSDGDTLTYSWDQFDAGTVSDAYADTGDNALFPVGPYLTVGGDNRAPRVFTGLATTNRNLTFKLVVRDGRGGVASKTTRVTVGDSGGGGSIDKWFLLLLLTLALSTLTAKQAHRCLGNRNKILRSSNRLFKKIKCLAGM